MQKSILIVLCAFLIFLPNTGAAKKEKVTICHKGHTITVAESALKAHLAHGDTLGECPEQPLAEGQIEHHYRYYPSVAVYYDKERELYFYLVGDTWQKNETLPESFAITEDEAVALTFETDMPYLRHQEVIQEYSVQSQIVKFHYRYYPGKAVYYDEGRKLYFYQVNETWEKSETLPESITITEDEAVTLVFKTDRPYLHHQEVIQLYPPELVTEPEQGKIKVAICHKGKTITVAESAVKAHLNHGDTLGACPGQGAKSKAKGPGKKKKK